MDDFHEMLCPGAKQDDFTKKMLTEFEFVGAKKVGDTYIGLQKLMYTTAICIGVDEWKPFVKRYCFEDITECLAQYELLDNPDHVPSGYIASRG